MTKDDLYNYQFIPIRVVDGDTIVIDVDLGCGIRLANRYCRLYGINTPELHGLTKVKGEESKKYLESIIINQPFLFGKSHGWDVFGRMLVTFYIPGNTKSINTDLLERGYAVIYK